jgi:hypothetical protein
MITFTLALLWVVFANLIDETTCLYSELCPGPALINATSPYFYYIDFPAARLALISSLSSSISLTLVGVLMAMYAYVGARRIVAESRAAQVEENRKCLNPYQFGVLIRVLNADLLVLWELWYREIKNAFWRLDREGSRKVGGGKRNVLGASIGVFVSCIVGR